MIQFQIDLCRALAVMENTADVMKVKGYDAAVKYSESQELPYRNFSQASIAAFQEGVISQMGKQIETFDEMARRVVG